MKITRSIIAAAFVALPATVFAQGFEGAEVSARLTALSNDRAIGVANYAGGFEFGLISGISVELDLASHDWRGISGRSNTVTLHSIYELWPETSIGLYVAQERMEGDKAKMYGFEGATSLGGVSVDGHLGRWEAGSLSGSTFGLDASFALGQAFAVTGGLAALGGDADLTTISLGGEYRFGVGPVVFAGVGHETEGSGSDTFLSIGARVELGRGTTFGDRSLSVNRPALP